MCNHDLGQTEVLGRQLYGKSKDREFVDIYKKRFDCKYIWIFIYRFRTENTSRITLPTNIIGEAP